ncbi:MAG: glycosyltransferase family 2 protein [Bacteroidales bacterium]
MRTSNTIDISIITVNYNGWRDTSELILSIREVVKSVSYEIIVVDNASKGEDVKQLKDRFPEIILIESKENLGFAGGNNLGIRASSGQYLFLLNNDTIVEQDGFLYLISRLNDTPGAGVVCPKIKFIEPGNPIQFAGYTPLSAVTLRNALIGFGEEDRNQYDKAHVSPYAHGAAMMLKREVIDQAGLMPECYFLYYEEIDWSERIKEAGFEIWYEPLCYIIHKESSSTGQESPLKTYYLTKNRLLFARRNRKALIRYASYAYQLLFSLPVNLYRYTKKGRSDLQKAAIKGVKDFFNS